MKKIIITCLIVLCSLSAVAEWKLVAKNGIHTFYIDPVTLRKDGNLRKVWEVIDFETRNESGAMSVRIRSEYDCKQERYKFLSISSHSGPMATGNTIFSDDEAEPKWNSIPPDSPIETKFSIVCAK